MTLKFQVSTLSKRDTNMAIATIESLVVICAAVSASAATASCVLQEISPGGDPVVTRFLPAPPSRAHEAIADAMQAAGVLLFKNTEQSVEGERAIERITVLGLLRGDEAIHAQLTPMIQDGKSGTQVRVETLRGGNKKGAPKHVWSAAVLDHAACLVSLLSLDDPSRRPRIPPADGAEIRVADSNSVPVRSRHFSFNTDLKTNQVFPFETAEDVVVNNSIVIPAGSAVTASIEWSSDIGEYGRGARAHLRFKSLVLPDGTHLPLRGIIDLQGKEVSKAFIAVLTVIRPMGGGSMTGTGFAIRAGALFRAEVDGEQKIRVSRATAATKAQD
jgi:hypothetical protein